MASEQLFTDHRHVLVAPSMGGMIDDLAEVDRGARGADVIRAALALALPALEQMSSEERRRIYAAIRSDDFDPSGGPQPYLVLAQPAVPA